MISVIHTELVEVIDAYYKSKKPLFIWGPTGIGKSTVIKDSAKEMAKSSKLKYNEDITKINDEKVFSIIDIRISQLEPSDLRGLPSINGDETRWLPPAWLPKNPKSKGIIFFDELNLSPPSIQSACYQLILDRRLGEYVLPDGYVIMSAGNRAEDRARIFEMAVPLQNRFGHVELEIPTAKQWTQWAVENGINPKIIGFINFKRDALFTYNSKMNEKTFATPRSWKILSDVIENVDGRKDDLLRISAESIVGRIASEFIAFHKLSKKINYSKILSNPKDVKKLEGLDEKYVVVGGLVDLYKEKYKKDTKILPQIMAVCKELESEFAVLLIRMLFRTNKKDMLEKLPKIPIWKNEMVKKYGKLLRSDK